MKSFDEAFNDMQSKHLKEISQYGSISQSSALKLKKQIQKSQIRQGKVFFRKDFQKHKSFGYCLQVESVINKLFGLLLIFIENDLQILLELNAKVEALNIVMSKFLSCFLIVQGSYQSLLLFIQDRNYCLFYISYSIEGMQKNMQTMVKRMSDLKLLEKTEGQRHQQYLLLNEIAKIRRFKYETLDYLTLKREVQQARMFSLGIQNNILNKLKQTRMNQQAQVMSTIIQLYSSMVQVLDQFLAVSQQKSFNKVSFIQQKKNKLCPICETSIQEGRLNIVRKYIDSTWNTSLKYNPKQQIQNDQNQQYKIVDADENQNDQDQYIKTVDKMLANKKAYSYKVSHTSTVLSETFKLNLDKKCDLPDGISYQDKDIKSAKDAMQYALKLIGVQMKEEMSNHLVPVLLRLIQKYNNRKQIKYEKQYLTKQVQTSDFDSLKQLKILQQKAQLLHKNLYYKNIQFQSLKKKQTKLEQQQANILNQHDIIVKQLQTESSKNKQTINKNELEIRKLKEQIVKLKKQINGLHQFQSERENTSNQKSLMDISNQVPNQNQVLEKCQSQKSEASKFIKIEQHNNIKQMQNPILGFKRNSSFKNENKPLISLTYHSKQLQKDTFKKKLTSNVTRNSTHFSKNTIDKNMNVNNQSQIIETAKIKDIVNSIKRPSNSIIQPTLPKSIENRNSSHSNSVQKGSVETKIQNTINKQIVYEKQSLKLNKNSELKKKKSLFVEQQKHAIKDDQSRSKRQLKIQKNQTKIIETPQQKSNKKQENLKKYKLVKNQTRFDVESKTSSPNEKSFFSDHRQTIYQQNKKNQDSVIEKYSSDISQKQSFEQQYEQQYENLRSILSHQNQPKLQQQIFQKGQSKVSIQYSMVKQTRKKHVRIASDIQKYLNSKKSYFESSSNIATMYSTPLPSQRQSKIQKLFNSKDLNDLFGSVQQAYQFQSSKIQSRTKFDQNSKQFIYELYHHINTLKKTHISLYEWVKNFLKFPYQTAINNNNNSDLATNLSPIMFESFFGRMFFLHEKCQKLSNKPYCHHIRKFLVKIKYKQQEQQKDIINLPSIINKS